MLRLSSTPIAITLVALLSVPGASLAQSQAGNPATPPSPKGVIVEWAPAAPSAERRAAREDAEVDFNRDLGSRRFQLVEPEPGQTPAEAVHELEADPAVVHAERDGLARELAVPDDPLFGQLWGLQNTGLGVDFFTGAVAGDDIDVLSAWERTVGTPSTIVADIDGGYRIEHPDLANVTWTNPGEIAGNGVDDDNDGIVDDVYGADFIGENGEAPAVDGDPTDDDPSTTGHGLHTAGTIGAEGNNGIGIVGVAQGVSLMPLRVCSIFPGAGERGCLFSAMIEAVNYAGAHGARVANISIGGEVRRDTLADAIAANPQTLFAIAAGNDNRNDDITPEYPCVYDPVAEGKGPVDNVICVAATDQADQRADFSNWGANSVDLGAPGTEILSAAPYHYFIKDDFEVDDFASKWTASGPDGGFARTDEAPLTSFGIGDSPGATPVAGSVRASTLTLTAPPGYRGCELEYRWWASGAPLRVELIVDGDEEIGVELGGGTGHRTHKLLSAITDGGEVELSFSYHAPATPEPGDGAWVDDVNLHCVAKLGEADGYRYASGTSMAAPHVTGAAALIFSLKPSASVTEVRQGLLRSIDPVSSLAGKTTTGGRLDVGAATDLFDPTPPPTPTLTATNPTSPANANQPKLKGLAQRGTSIDVYADADCSGSPVASGTAAQLASPGIAVAVADATTTQFSIEATDLVPHTSACSAPISYTENTDLVPPAPPQLVGTDPASPGVSGTPRIFGAAEVGSTVRIYAGMACGGAPIATGSAAALGSPGIAVAVADGVTAIFSATATDASANASACSASISYTRLETTTDSGGGGDSTGQGGGNDSPTPIPVCTVPRLIGRTLAQAKTSLRAAGCRLGKVRRPRPRKGSRPALLVVRASTPTAGATSASGAVNLRLRPRH